MKRHGHIPQRETMGSTFGSSHRGKEALRKGQPEASPHETSKLKVRWLNTTTQATTNRTYYLLSDRTISTDVNNVNRMDGTIKSIYVEADTEAEMYEEVINEFQSNSYEHKITFYLRENSLLYLPDDYYVGRKCQVETKTGVKTSLITAIEREASSGVRKVTLGKLKVTLTSKLRGAVT